MDYSGEMDMSCEMKVNRNCEVCRRKVTEVMHSVNVVYSVDFVGGDNTIKLKARANPNMIFAVMERYGDHGKISNLRFDGEVITPRAGGGFYSQSGYFAPSNAAGNYPYHSPYPNPSPQFFAGNYAYPMANPPRQTEATWGMKNQHTAPPPYTQQPPPPRPLYSYAYIEPPYLPTSSKDAGWCVIM